MNELIDFSHLKFDKDSNSGSDEKYNDLYNNDTNRNISRQKCGCL